MRWLVFLILRWTGVPFLLREFVQRNRVSILCYHDPDPEIAQQHIEVLKRLYSIVPLSAYIDARQKSTATKLPKKSLVITFDDGHKGNFSLLPLLRAHQVPITIFLCSSIVGTNRHYWWKECPDINTVHALKSLDNEKRLSHLASFGFQEDREYSDRQSLTREEIYELRAYADLQAHSRYHSILPQCTNERSWDEIAGSKTELEKSFGLCINAFAYPNGNYSQREIVLAKEAGYACALTIDGGYNSLNTDMFRLKRLSLNDAADPNELIVKSSGLWAILQRFLGK